MWITNPRNHDNLGIFTHGALASCLSLEAEVTVASAHCIITAQGVSSSTELKNVLSGSCVVWNDLYKVTEKW